MAAKKKKKKKASPATRELEKTLLENLEAHHDNAEQLERDAFWESLEEGPSPLFEDETKPKKRPPKRP